MAMLLSRLKEVVDHSVTNKKEDANQPTNRWIKIKLLHPLPGKFLMLFASSF